MNHKLISLITAIFLAVGYLNVFAANDSGWSVVNHGQRNYSSEVNTQAFYEGEKSFKAVYTGIYKEGEYLEIKGNLSEPLELGEYTLCFKYRGRINKELIYFNIGSQKICLNDANWSITSSIGEDTVSWNEAKINFIAALAGSTDIGITVFGGAISLFIDNIELMRDSGDNIVIDSGFEGVDQELVIPDDYDGTLYTPTRTIIGQKNGIITLSWVNPEVDTIDRVSVFEVTDGEQLLSANLSTDKGATIKYETEKLEMNMVHTYKIVYHYSDMPRVEYFMSTKVKSEPYAMTVGDLKIWYRVYLDTDSILGSKALVEYDTAVSRTGNASMKVMSNMEGEEEIYFRRPIPELLTGKKYEFSYWVKAKRIDSAFAIHFNWLGYFDEGMNDARVVTRDGYDWTQFKRTITPAENISSWLMFEFYGGNEFWLDDVELYEVLENEECGENLITDGDFEAISEIDKPGSIADIESSGYNQNVKLSWEQPSGADKVNIYQKIGEKWVARGFVHPSVTNIEFNSFIPDTQNLLKLCTVNSSGVSDDGKEVSVFTVLPEYTVNEPALNDLGNGNYKVSVKVKNNLKEGGMDTELMVGLYDGNALKRVFSVAKKIPKKATTSEPTTVSIAFTNPNGFKVRAFVIDSRLEKNLLADAKEFN